MNCTTSPEKFQPLTLESIAMMDAPFLTPEEVCEVLSCNPTAIRKQAATTEGRQALGFTTIRLGDRTKIPRIPFLRFMGWEGVIIGSREEAHAG